MKIVRAQSQAFERELARIESRQVRIGGKVSAAVRRIVADVQKRGDEAVFDYTRRFDRLSLTPRNLTVARGDLKKAYKKIDPKLRRSLQQAARRIREYQVRQRRSSWSYHDHLGATLGLRYSALDAVCCYVPGGKAAYPSTLLMTAIPARIAGVKRVYVASPGASLSNNPVVLAAAYIAGVDAVYRIGGAQAVAAFAYGTKSVPGVAKIVGPGNAYVAEAKRQVFGKVGIDQLAGPSEIVVVADGGADARTLAWDLLSQAEHDEMATAVLFTDSEELARDVADEAAAIAASSPRSGILKKSLASFGRIFVLGKLEEAAAYVNCLAPEHVELCVAHPHRWVPKIHHAGAIFVGGWTPEAVGDYIAGSNHVLPTGGAARFGSPLGVDDFLKKTSTVEFSERALRRLGPSIVSLATAEGLHAHAGSVAERLQKPRTRPKTRPAPTKIVRRKKK